MKKVLIIAEAGVNHNGDMDLAKQLIDVAAEAGADIVKFQSFKAEELVSKSARKAEYQIKNTGSADNSQYQMLKKLELTNENAKFLKEYCDVKGVKFLSTPFDENSMDELEEAGLVDFFKIPSGEITNLNYLRKIGSKNKPVIMSTGMSEMSEVAKALEVILTSGNLSREDITILHCNTDYPTKMDDVNLRAMQTIGEALKTPIGYSDHTPGIEVPIAAVALGASVIEKHFTLDKSMPGPDHKASLEPSELKAMVKAIRNIEIALGSSVKKPSASESKNISIARKSIHVRNAVKAGRRIEQNDLVMKRPGDGISPMLVDLIIGKVAQKDLPEDHILNWSDIT